MMHYQKKYIGKYRFAKTVFTFDLILLGIALGLSIIALLLFFFKPENIADKIYFEAQVAPQEIVTGAPSTLVIRYTNGTGQELKDVFFTFGYPEHFTLESLGEEKALDKAQKISVGTIPVGETGSVKLRGVMFGDIGGEQIFRSIMNFTYGEENFHSQKLDYHTFSPSRSALALDVALPNKLVANQEVSGSLLYKNTADIDSPSVFIEPVWPENFEFSTSDVPVINEKWQLPAIAAGADGVIQFTGELGDHTESVTFSFIPSFVFGQTQYSQDVLRKNIALVPPQIQLSYDLNIEQVRPGGEIEAVVRLENTGETPVKNLQIYLESESAFIITEEPIEFDQIEPGETQDVLLSAQVRSTISQNETEDYENIQVDLTPIAVYSVADIAQEVKTRGETINKPLITPLILRSFGRYSTEQGDQIGRGPLPPIVGEETKYWILVNITGTTNPIERVSLSGQLANGIRFTGRQTVSQGDSISYNPETNSVSWSASAVQPTFGPTSQIIGLAFEVGITPDRNDAGTSPLLLSEILIRGIDKNTGAFVSASGEPVTTNLPHDAMVEGFGIVEF